MYVLHIKTNLHTNHGNNPFNCNQIEIPIYLHKYDPHTTLQKRCTQFSIFNFFDHSFVHKSIIKKEL